MRRDLVFRFRSCLLANVFCLENLKSEEVVESFFTWRRLGMFFSMDGKAMVGGWGGWDEKTSAELKR